MGAFFKAMSPDNYNVAQELIPYIVTAPLVSQEQYKIFKLLSPEDINYDDAACSKFKEDKYQHSSNALFCKSRKVLNTEAVIS